MGQCDCWVATPGQWQFATGRCVAAPNMAYCSCNGKTEECDFYEHKRKKEEHMKLRNLMGLLKDEQIVTLIVEEEDSEIKADSATLVHMIREEYLDMRLVNIEAICDVLKVWVEGE